ncbi:MAG: L-threonylcarbamoyladenylate synthase [Bacteroidia bacterium]
MIGKDVAKASILLAQGQLVAIPTETVYGLAANALDPDAIADIYRVKNRPNFNPLILHIKSIAEASKYAKQISNEAKLLMTKFWPGSLSILLPKSDIVPDVITAGSESVVLRMPNHPTTLSLLDQVDFPLAAPSANISNTVSPTTAQHVEDGLGESISYILDGGPCKVGLESTIVSVVEGRVHILRDGGITREEIEAKTGLSVVKNKSKEIHSPGQLKKHYSTSKPLYIVDSISDSVVANPQIKCSALLFEDMDVDCLKHLLSKDYNLAEIANSLFQAMRAADKDDTELILVEKVREEGIGRAVADRLRRAAS